MEIKQIIKQIEENLDELHITDILTIDVKKLTTVTDVVIICTGRSRRHVKSSAKHLMENLKKQGTPAINNSGVNEGEWALIDFGDVIVHIMQREVRSFYNLEGIWQVNSTHLSANEN